MNNFLQLLGYEICDGFDLRAQSLRLHSMFHFQVLLIVDTFWYGVRFQLLVVFLNYGWAGSVCRWCFSVLTLSLTKRQKDKTTKRQKGKKAKQN